MATEPRWYIEEMRRQANAECYDWTPAEDEVPSLSYDDAVAWCAECAGPIFDGMPTDGSEPYLSEGTDRHGQHYSYTIPAFVWHANPAHCLVES